MANDKSDDFDFSRDAEMNSLEVNHTAEDVKNSHEESTVQIRDALESLPLFDELYLRMQALNLDVVDGYLEGIETDLLREYIEIERTPVQSAIFVSALSQLWVFGLYELLRTWRQRVTEVITFGQELASASTSDRDAKVAKHKTRIVEASESAIDREYYWDPFEAIARDGSFAETLQYALDRTEVFFRRIEALRVSLAKHQVPKSKGAYAMAPGYGRIDMTDGSIYWQIALGGDYIDLVSRRALADQCRSLALDRPDLILPTEIQKLISRLPRESYGIHRVAVTLADGAEYEALVSWSKQVTWVKGMRTFDARNIIDVAHVPRPEDSQEYTKLDEDHRSDM